MKWRDRECKKYIFVDWVDLEKIILDGGGGVCGEGGGFIFFRFVYGIYSICIYSINMGF